MFARVFIFLLVVFFRCGTCNVVKRSTSCRDNVCEFRWIIDYKFTMMWYNETSEGTVYQPIVQDSKGFIRRRSTSPNCSETHEAVSLDEFKELVSTGDGDYRMVYAINGQIPGPEIVVTEGDVVAILVYNRLKMEGVTIHWHGLLHKGTPWMDGASMISQCPIMPGQVFEYRFIAEPVGTHWYHAHTGTMRNDGLSGAFIVLPKQQMFLRYHGEFFAVIQDWTKRSAAETAEAYGSRLFGLEDYDGTCKPVNYMPDETTSIFPLNVGLVNGRGRRYTETDIENGEKPFIPLETFTVQQMGTYRFRIMNVGFAQPFEISFEAHTIYVVAMDGNDVEDQKCDSVVISPGETVDIKLTAKRQPNNYYINIKTIPTRTLWGPITRPQLTRAVLNYKGVNRFRRPVSVPRLCTQQNPCYVVNQIYGKAPIDSNAVIIPLTRLKSTHNSLTLFPVPIDNDQSHLQEFFLNFHLLRGFPAINGRRFMYPTSALQGQNNQNAISQCEPPRCTSERCRCTHMIKLEIGNVIQFVFFTQGLKAAHPVHFHGHQFHVVKIGFPEYDSVTGNATAPNADIRCLNDDCTEATWANPRWRYNVPGLNLWNPPIKDTINVPWGGYVVVRIVADNPGYWLLHCHLGYHQSQGMSLILQEGDPVDMVEPPTSFPTCNSFRTSTKGIQSAINKQKEILDRKKRRFSKMQPNTKRTLQEDKTVTSFFHQAENQETRRNFHVLREIATTTASPDVWPSGLPTRHWPQTQSRESSGSRSNRINAGSFPLLPESSKTSEIPTLPLPLTSGSRSNRINAGSFPLLPEPSKTSEIPTLPLPGRSNPDNSFDSWNSGLADSVFSSAFGNTDVPVDLPQLRPINTFGPSVPALPASLTNNDRNRRLDPPTSAVDIFGVRDSSSVTMHDNLISDTTISGPFTEPTSNDPFAAFRSFDPVDSLSDNSIPSLFSTFTSSPGPFIDSTDNNLFADTTNNAQFADTTMNDQFGDTISNNPFADTSNIPFTDTASNNPFGDTTSNIPFSGITSNEPFFDSQSNVPSADTSSNAPFGELTSFYDSAGSTDPVLVQSPMRLSELEPISSSSGTGIPSSSLPGFSSGGGLPDQPGSSSFTDSGNLNEFFIG